MFDRTRTAMTFKCSRPEPEGDSCHLPLFFSSAQKILCSVLNSSGNSSVNAMNNNDAELLRQYAVGNSHSAFAELVHRHIDLVYSVALRRVGGDAHSARDVAQTVFVALARNARSLTSRTTLAGWLYLTSKQQAAQLVRSERRRQTREHEAYAMNEIFNTPDIDWRQLRPVLDDTMQELSESEREAILLRYFEQRPFADVGRALLVSEDAARMRVDRALEKLRARLARRGVSSTAAALAAVLGQQVAAAPANLATSITQAVAGIPAAVGTKIFMSTTQLLTGASAGVVIATAVIFSRATSHQAAEVPLAPQQPIASGVPLATDQLRPSSIAPAPAVIAAANPDVTPTRAVNQSPREEREPRDSVEVRRGELKRQLANFRSLLEELNLTSEQREVFDTLLTANFERHSDLREFARTQGARPADLDVNALGAQADAELATQIRTAFGNSVYAAFEHFNETGPMREFTHHLAVALAPSPDPLSSTQVEQLVEILASHSRAADGHISGDPWALDLEATVADARQVLTATQLAALRQLHAAKR